MTQLSYQPAFDAYNATFRILRLRDLGWRENPVPFEKLRIADFFLLFPFHLQSKELRFKTEDRDLRAIGREYESYRPYSRLPDMKSLYYRISPFQLAAIENLVSFGYVDEKKWQNREILATSANLPEKLQTKIIQENDKDSKLINGIGKIINNYDLMGENGLKSRTGLMEHRYDVV